MTIEEQMKLNLYSELRRIYQMLEEELTQLNPGCNRCGACCNFSTFDHVLYASSVEVNLITSNVEVPVFNVSDNICPFLKENQCSIRTFRTLGCRVFYCNPNYKDVLYTIYENYYQMIKDLSRKYTIQWKYLPFLKQLAEFKSEQLLLVGKPNSSPV
ncbi:MAG: YkgJ family cysteine cluster protein [Candidatus Brocadia sp.]|nr:YkgJ family cysteine cluster protein [Candidatus Brocadia sp.]